MTNKECTGPDVSSVDVDEPLSLSNVPINSSPAPRAANPVLIPLPSNPPHRLSAGSKADIEWLGEHRQPPLRSTRSSLRACSPRTVPASRAPPVMPNSCNSRSGNHLSLCARGRYGIGSRMAQARWRKSGSQHRKGRYGHGRRSGRVLRTSSVWVCCI